MLDIDKDAVFLGCGKESLVVLESFDRWLRDEHVNLALNSIESNWVVSGIWSKYSNGGAGS